MADLRHIRPFLAVLALLSVIVTVMADPSVAMAYCASVNTASGSGNFSTYQSDGLCYDLCKDNYAYAVVQGQYCWCSDYTPDSSDQVDTSKCDTQCAGYPSDTCGGDGLWGYMAGDASPSGTSGGSGSATATGTSTTQGTTETVQTTVIEVTSVQNTHSTTTIVTTTTFSTDPPSSTTSSSTDDPDTSTATTGSPAATTTDNPTTATPVVSTVTEAGQVHTVTVVPTADSSSSAAISGSTSTSSGTSHHSGLSTGGAVGVAVGVLAGVVGIVAALFFFWFRRRQRAQEEAILSHQNSLRGSSAGILDTPRTDMASVWDSEAQSTGRRNSRLMPHDPRMDPFAANIYTRFENKSHESLGSLRDDQDYSRRVLRTTNPDPDVD